MKKLSDSMIFSKLVNNPDLLKNMSLLSNSNTTEFIKESDLVNEFSTIDRRFNYATKDKILDLFKKGKIVLLNKPQVKLPLFITGVPAKGINGNAVFVNLASFMNGNGEIYPKMLYALMQNAMVTIMLMDNWNKFTMNAAFLKTGSLVYSRLITKIFDKIFALDLDPFKSDFMSYVFAKFFLVNMCERTTNNDMNASIAYGSCFNKSNLELIKEFEGQLNQDMYKDIFTLIESLKEVSGFKTLNFRSFTENYLRFYGEASLLSIDYLPAFIQMMLNTAIAANICKDYQLENVAGKHITKTVTALNALY